MSPLESCSPVHMEPHAGVTPQQSVPGGKACEADLHQLMREIDIMVSHRAKEWEKKNHDLQIRLQEREAQLTHSRMQVRNLHRQVEETERVQREAEQRLEDRLGSLRSELEKLKEGYGRMQACYTREAVRSALDGNSSSESGALGRKLQEFRIKSKEWERQRSLYLKDLAALEVNRRSLAAKYKLFQLTSGRYHSPQTGQRCVETQDEDITGLQTPLHAPSEAAQEDDVTARKPMDGVGAMRTDQRSLLEANSLQQLQDELSRLGAELQASSDLLQATRLEEKRWKREAARLREQLTAQGTATRQECEIQGQAMAEELRRLREQVGRVQGQLETSALREEQLREDIVNLQNRLGSSRSDTAQLRDALAEREAQLRGLENAGKQKDNEIVTLREKLVKQQAGRSKMEALREEIQNMQAQLRDRERAALSANHRAAQLERQMLSITEKAKEYQVAQIQLEALRLENKHLKELISGTQSSTSLILQPMGDRPVCDVTSDVTWDVSGDSGQWEEEEFQPGETGNSADSRRSIVAVPLTSSWEQTEPSDHPEARSPTPKPGDCYYSHGNIHREEGFTAGPPSPLSSMVDRFLQEEEQRMLGLEQNFNSYVQELHGDTRRTLLKYSVRHPGNDTS